MKLFSSINIIMPNLRDKSTDEKHEFIFIAVAFFCFASLAALSMINFMWLINMSGQHMSGEPEIQNNRTDKAAISIDDIRSKYNIYLNYKTYSSQGVSLAASTGRSPVSDPATMISDVNAAAIIKEIIPLMKIKALVVLDGVGVATLDIDSELRGIVVHVGSVFGGGKGKITAIDAKGVYWTWSGKKHHTGL